MPAAAKYIVSNGPFPVGVRPLLCHSGRKAGMQKEGTHFLALWDISATTRNLPKGTIQSLEPQCVVSVPCLCEGAATVRKKI